MIKIAHEAPLDIFEEVQRFTDYDYALVHLLEENPRYRDAFERAIKKKGREVILDNSIFELEEAFEADKFAYWVDRIRPEWYIVPDALENSLLTMSQMEMVIGRLGIGSKMIICGDTTQIDLRNKKDSGLDFLNTVAARISGVNVITLKQNHRHEIVPEILEIYKYSTG